jgi:hypothetical protein
MINHSTNINKTNNHLSPSLTEHEEKTMTHDVGNPGPGGHPRNTPAKNALNKQKENLPCTNFITQVISKLSWLSSFEFPFVRLFGVR